MNFLEIWHVDIWDRDKSAHKNSSANIFLFKRYKIDKIIIGK
jgi:hypothetical protein